jgi:REP element-mobilizing transposase RayT
MVFIYEISSGTKGYFLSDGYFVSSIGNVSEKTIKEYIEKPKLEIEKSNSSTTLKM